MTRNTNRNYVKPMFGLIAQMMMVLFCLCWTIRTLQGISPNHFASCNSMRYGCLSLFGQFVFLLITLHCLFAFCTLSIPFLGLFILVAFSILLSDSVAFFRLPDICLHEDCGTFYNSNGSRFSLQKP